MKKFLFMAVALVMGTAMFTSCSKDEVAPAVTVDSKVIELTQGDTIVLSPKFDNLTEDTKITWFDAKNSKLGEGKSYTYKARVAGEDKVKVVAENLIGTSEAYYSFNIKEDIRTVTFEGEKWNELIDSKQYKGDLLYGLNADSVVDYSWTDINTKLSSKLTASWGGKYGFAEGGIAISNYVDNNIKEHNNYNYQLSVPSLEANNGKNFAVVYCEAEMSFSDKRARAIKSIDVSPTTYELGVAKYGDGYAKALTDKGDNLVLTITGYDKAGNVVGTQEIDMARDGKFMENWQTIVLNGTVNGRTYTFEKAVSYKFTMTGSDASSYGGIKTPTYFAFDNVVVSYYAE